MEPVVGGKILMNSVTTHGSREATNRGHTRNQGVDSKYNLFKNWNHIEVIKKP